MNYEASISDFFKAPQWKNNLLLGAVTFLIPVVGPLVLAGWHATCLWSRGDHDDPSGYPPFDFHYFTKYLERGLWPFLVAMVSMFVLIPLMMLVFMPLMFMMISMEPSHGHGSEAAYIAMIVGMCVLEIFLMAGIQFVLTPLQLRATITQDFKAAFDFQFAKNFIKATWKEQLVSLAFMFGVMLCAMVITIITCYIGMFVAMPLVAFAWAHLHRQFYRLYLSRGGEAVPLSAKLYDLPPPLPLG